MYYAIHRSANGSEELHVFKVRALRDCHVTQRETRDMRIATAGDAKACKPWSLVLHDFGLGELAGLPGWLYRLAARSRVWFAESRDLHLCLV